MSEASAGKRPGRGAVQARECSQSGEWRAQARAGQLRPVSVHSVYCPQRLQHLPRPTYLAIIGWVPQKNRFCDASLGLFRPTELIIPAFGTEGYCEMVEKVAGKDIDKAVGQYSMLTMARVVTKQIVRSWGTKSQE